MRGFTSLQKTEKFMKQYCNVMKLKVKYTHQEIYRHLKENRSYVIHDKAGNMLGEIHKFNFQ